MPIAALIVRAYMNNYASKNNSVTAERWLQHERLPYYLSYGPNDCLIFLFKITINIWSHRGYSIWFYGYQYLALNDYDDQIRL